MANRVIVFWVERVVKNLAPQPKYSGPVWAPQSFLGSQEMAHRLMNGLHNTARKDSSVSDIKTKIISND